MVIPFFNEAHSGGVAAGLILRRQNQQQTGVGIQRGPVPARWILASDEVGVSVRAPHEVRAVQEDLNLQVNTFGSLTDAENSSMMLPNQPRSISVTAEWRASHNRDDIRGPSEALKRLARHDPKLGRHPLIVFRWAHLNLEGWLQNIAFEWVDGTFDSPPYLPQGFVVRISVVAAQPRELQRSTRFERFTKYRRLGSGETFESVAHDEYGDPDLGNVLRRHNPGVAMTGEQPGDVIRIFEKSHSYIREGDPNPQSPALGGDVREVLQGMAEERLLLRGPGLAALELELGL